MQEGLLSTYIFHGASRNANTAFLTKHDIVITTYQTVSFALDKQTETLQLFNKIKFRRYDRRWRRGRGLAAINPAVGAGFSRVPPPPG